MNLFRNINTPGHYALLLTAVVIRFLLFYFSPTYHSYVYDFYDIAINLVINNGGLIDAADCFICYHPPLFPLIGAALFKIASLLGGGVELQHHFVGIFTIVVSLVFCLFSYGIYRLHHQENTKLSLTIWALILFLPLVFISSYSIEADLLVATFIVMALYFFLIYRENLELKPLFYSALFVGLAALTKYSGLICCVLLGLFLLYDFLKEKSYILFRNGCLFAVTCFVIGGYPYVHNWAEFDTPFKGNMAWSDDNYYVDTYRFSKFNIEDIVDVLEYQFDGVGDKRMHAFPAYDDDVFTSIYGQLWTDFSFFSSYARHGGGIMHAWHLYPTKNIPIELARALLYLGLIPLLFSIIGLFLIIRQKKEPVLMSFALITLVVYFEWMFGYFEWMIKSKYLIQLLPLWLILIGYGAQHLSARYAYLFIIPSVVCSLFYCLYFAVT